MRLDFHSQDLWLKQTKLRNLNRYNSHINQQVVLNLHIIYYSYMHIFIVAFTFQPESKRSCIFFFTFFIQQDIQVSKYSNANFSFWYNLQYINSDLSLVAFSLVSIQMMGSYYCFLYCPIYIQIGLCYSYIQTIQSISYD